MLLDLKICFDVNAVNFLVQECMDTINGCFAKLLFCKHIKDPRESTWLWLWDQQKGSQTTSLSEFSVVTSSCAPIADLRWDLQSCLDSCVSQNTSWSFFFPHSCSVGNIPERGNEVVIKTKRGKNGRPNGVMLLFRSKREVPVRACTHARLHFSLLLCTGRCAILKTSSTKRASVICWGLKSLIARSFVVKERAWWVQCFWNPKVHCSAGHPLCLILLHDNWKAPYLTHSCTKQSIFQCTCFFNNDIVTYHNFAQ